jgi:hypothetical protein
MMVMAKRENSKTKSKKVIKEADILSIGRIIFEVFK